MELLCQEMEKLTKPSNTISDILEQMASLVAPIASKAKIGISGNKEEEERRRRKNFMVMTMMMIIMLMRMRILNQTLQNR